MLEYYIELKFKVLQLRDCAAGEYMDHFAEWLRSAGYRRRPAQLLLRGAAHLSQWISIRKVRIDQIDQPTIDSFACHLATCACTHVFHGRDRYNLEGARRFVEHLQHRGILPPPEVESRPLPVLVETFSDWMRFHRGATESTIAQYVPIIKEFLADVGVDTGQYDATVVRKFILGKMGQTGRSRAKSVANSIRMFLRFLSTKACCSPDLIGAVPRIAHWRLSSLPRYISTQDIERLVESCNPSTAGGARDRAIILLLARLALRAGDVRDLRFHDIDWSNARLRVSGKGRSETRLPLPQDAGDAILHYWQNFRPRVNDDHVFLRIRPPFGPLPSSGPISGLVGRALRKTGIQAPSMGAHLLRHSAATAMLRHDSSLEVIGAVLRHHSVESTAHYAKVDLALLRSVVQPWPGNGGSSC
jgi:integrase/recombinase XerD